MSKLALFTLMMALMVSFASAAAVILDRPIDSFVGASGLQEFVFIASGAFPLSCGLFVDGAKITEKQVTDSNESLFAAVLPDGLHDWHINCVDVNGEGAESELRKIIVSVQESVPMVSSEFSIMSGAVVSSSSDGFVKNWKTVKGEKVFFSSSVSNKGVSPITAFLTLKIKDSLEKTVAEIESAEYSFSPSEARTLQVAWTPEQGGSYYVEGTVKEGVNELQHSFIKLSVVERVEENALFAGLAIICLLVTAFASIGTSRNLKNFRTE